MMPKHYVVIKGIRYEVRWLEMYRPQNNNCKLMRLYKKGKAYEILPDIWLVEVEDK